MKIFGPTRPRLRKSGLRPTVGFLILVVGAPGLIPTGADAQTILNVERLQPDEVEGWHWGVEGSFSLSDGNTEYVDLLAGVALGHRWQGHWIRVFAGLEYLTEGGSKSEHDRYLHVRYNHNLSERWKTFHFLQLQASHASLLQRRTLLGTGLRVRLLGGTGTLDVGTGAMYEAEDLDGGRLVGSHPEESRQWRMANLVVATRPLTESVRLIGVSYIQPDLGELDDVRLLTDLSLLVSLTENVDLTIRGEWRHDSRPPENVGPDDVVVSTGFAVSFR